jgi:hypothetical protein
LAYVKRSSALFEDGCGEGRVFSHAAIEGELPHPDIVKKWEKESVAKRQRGQLYDNRVVDDETLPAHRLHKVRSFAGGISLRRTTMEIRDLPFVTTNWSEIIPTEHAGEHGVARWRTRNFGSIRVRMVDYSPGYAADHWCAKGHILLCLEGELHTELEDGRRFILLPGTSYQVADNAERHRSSTAVGAKLFIVD